MLPGIILSHSSFTQGHKVARCSIQRSIESFHSKVKDTFLFFFFTFMAIRAFLSAGNFERLMFVKGNQHNIKKEETQPVMGFFSFQQTDLFIR